MARGVCRPDMTSVGHHHEVHARGSRSTRHTLMVAEWKARCDWASTAAEVAACADGEADGEVAQRGASIASLEPQPEDPRRRP